MAMFFPTCKRFIVIYATLCDNNKTKNTKREGEKPFLVMRCFCFGCFCVWTVATCLCIPPALGN
jgi:predicted metal-binding membrane protein